MGYPSPTAPSSPLLPSSAFSATFPGPGEPGGLRVQSQARDHDTIVTVDMSSRVAFEERWEALSLLRLPPLPPSPVATVDSASAGLDRSGSLGKRSARRKPPPALHPFSLPSEPHTLRTGTSTPDHDNETYSDAGTGAGYSDEARLLSDTKRTIRLTPNPTPSSSRSQTPVHPHQPVPLVPPRIRELGREVKFVLTPPPTPAKPPYLEPPEPHRIFVRSSEAARKKRMVKVVLVVVSALVLVALLVTVVVLAGRLHPIDSTTSSHAGSPMPMKP